MSRKVSENRGRNNYSPSGSQSGDEGSGNEGGNEDEEKDEDEDEGGENEEGENEEGENEEDEEGEVDIAAEVCHGLTPTCELMLIRAGRVR